MILLPSSVRIGDGDSSCQLYVRSQHNLSIELIPQAPRLETVRMHCYYRTHSPRMSSLSPRLITRDECLACAGSLLPVACVC